jgi:hypothetical protein
MAVKFAPQRAEGFVVARNPRVRRRLTGALTRAAVEALERRELLANDPIITEFLASNAGGLEDFEGDTPDWIEIYNPSAATINLAGWSLTDDKLDLDKWVFPSVDLPSGGRLLVFASGKDLTAPQLHTDFKLASTAGGYLALAKPDQTIVSSYEDYPEQVENVSYGIATTTSATSLLLAGSALKYFVPANGNLGTTSR